MTKRLFDFLISSLALLALSPLLLMIALIIRISSPGPVFYRGVRIGRNQKPFRIYKFRTMVVDAEKTGVSSTASDDPRITRIGAFLRATKLDELPQLINVLDGSMSFVGPRPQVVWALERYSEEEKRVFQLRPGITDYASLTFHNEGEILKGSTNPDEDYFIKIHPEKVRLQLEYLRSNSFFGDFAIIIKTLVKVLRK